MIDLIDGYNIIFYYVKVKIYKVIKDTNYVQFIITKGWTNFALIILYLMLIYINKCNKIKIKMKFFNYLYLLIIIKKLLIIFYDSKFLNIQIAKYSLKKIK